MSNYLFINQEKSAELLVPLTPVDYTLQAQNDRLIYVPLATRDNFGIVKIGEGLNIEHGLLSFDRKELDVKLSTNVGSENARKFLSVSDNGNIIFVDKVQNITKISELENDAGYITNYTNSLVNYYDSLKVDQLFTAAITEAENAKAIAMGKSDSKVFNTYDDMITWLGDENNKGKLIVGSNLFIIADNEPDYWVTDVFYDFPTHIGEYPSYYSILPLESKLPDISSMCTTDTEQTISGSKDFTGGLKKNGKDVSTEEQVNTLSDTVSSHTEQITALNGQINTQGESIGSLQTTKADKSELPTRVSDLQNDAEYVTESELTQKDYATNTAVSTNYVKKSDYQEFAINVNTAMTELSDNVDILQSGKADKTEIPTNADFTLAGLSEKSYNSLTDKPNIPEGVKLYDTTGQNTDGGMTQKAVTDELAKKLDTTKGVTIDTEQTITTQKTYDANIMLKNNKWIVNEQGRNIISKETTSGNQTVVGNTFDKTVIVSSSRPAVASGTDKEEMAFITDIPTKTSDLENDSGFVTSSAIPTKTSQLTNDSNFVTSSAIPTKTSQLTNDSGFMTSSTVPNNFQPAPNHLGTPTTPPNDSLWTPAKSGWVMFSCTSHNDGAEFYLKIGSSEGLMVGCSLALGGGSMRYNNCPSMTLPVEAGETYYVHYSRYSAHYYSS